MQDAGGISCCFSSCKTFREPANQAKGIRFSVNYLIMGIILALFLIYVFYCVIPFTQSEKRHTQTFCMVEAKGKKKHAVQVLAPETALKHCFGSQNGTLVCVLAPVRSLYCTLAAKRALPHTFGTIRALWHIFWRLPKQHLSQF